ncbi:Hypothetical protein R9X50_00248800 [Acrodontium crateriforme]|uniref:Magnesium transporter n=1 Tax=Acrodontium crateriforme TaxID=150365 RepID=A0AAQ3R920_9PEZI|nr:Hypothetical protein R9X50_00248800 [Acrodontium crateriforme]
MALVANAINVLGILFLSHAVYSAWEHSLLPSSSLPPSPSSILPQALDPKINLPLDIVLETLASVFFLCLGVVLSSPSLKPIQWSAWAGRLERCKEARKYTEFGVGGGNPYENLEERPGFLDIRGANRDFAEWIRHSKTT